MISNESRRTSSSQEEPISSTPTSSPDLCSKYSDDATRSKKLVFKDDGEDFNLEEFASRH